MKQIALQHIARIPPAPKGFEFVSVGISLKGEALFLYIEKSSKAYIGQRGESPGPMPSFNAEGRVELIYKLRVMDGEASREMDLPRIDFGFPRIDLLSDGSFVLVNAHAQWKSSGEYDLNGLIYDRATGEKKRFFAGDGIQDIGVDGHDRIWVSYFEWGVDGVFGFRGAGADFKIQEGPHLIGREGLNCFDHSGELIWQHDQKEMYVGDCTALNVSREAAHFVFSPDLYLGGVSSGFESDYRRINLTNSSCFAISPERAFFIRGAGRSLGTAYLMSFEPSNASSLVKCQLVLSNGNVVKSGRAVGRGASLHLFTKKDWYSVNLQGL